MKWPLVWRSTMERERSALVQRATYAESERHAAQIEANSWKAHVWNHLAIETPTALVEWISQARAALVEYKDADAARIRAEVRAEQWEAIAKELISRGAGRPTVERPARPDDPIAKRIREVSEGDPALAAHFRQYAQELRKAGKKDEEIVGMIGWDVVNDPSAEAS